MPEGEGVALDHVALMVNRQNTHCRLGWTWLLLVAVVRAWVPVISVGLAGRRFGLVLASVDDDTQVEFVGGVCLLFY